MTAADLDAVAAIAAVGFPDHFEGRDCFENRLALNPSDCFVLADGEGPPQGYLVAYPWTANAAPALNTLIGGDPGRRLGDVSARPRPRPGGPRRRLVQAHRRAAGAGGAISRLAGPDAGGRQRRRTVLGTARLHRQ